MKRQFSIFLVLLLQMTLSCQNNTNQKPILSRPIDYIPKADSIRIDSNKTRRLDSSKLIKAFDNISFGLPEQKPIYNESGYAINEVPFEISNKEYYGDFGLYYFQLTASQANDFDHLSETLQKVIKIINIKYGKPNNINFSIPDGFKELFSKGQGPKDDGTLYYKYQWIKNGIKIKLGYEIGYRYEYEKELAHSPSGGMVETDSKKVSNSIKTALPKLSFEYLPVSEKIDKENIKTEKDRIKNEAEKL